MMVSFTTVHAAEGFKQPLTDASFAILVLQRHTHSSSISTIQVHRGDCDNTALLHVAPHSANFMMISQHPYTPAGIALRGEMSSCRQPPKTVLVLLAFLPNQNSPPGRIEGATPRPRSRRFPPMPPSLVESIWGRSFQSSRRSRGPP